MKLIILLLTFCHACLATPLQDRKITPSSLKELTTALHIEGDIVAETQKHWIRKAGKERWEMKELDLDQKSFVLTWAEKHNFFAEWKPVSTIYDTALILGATTGAMKTRLNYLKKLWLDGVRFEKIVWLTGERPLDERVDCLLEGCRTESEAACILWKNTEIPDDMRNLPVIFVSTRMKAPTIRPTTADTIYAWLSTPSTPCRALFVSNQPFCGAQFATIKSILPETFLFDVVGPYCSPINHESMAAITLDSIARWIYQDK